MKIIKTGMDNVSNVPIIHLGKIQWILTPNVSKFDLPWQTTSSIKRYVHKKNLLRQKFIVTNVSQRMGP